MSNNSDALILGHNRFSDWTKEEYRKLLGKINTKSMHKKRPYKELPEWDFRILKSTPDAKSNFLTNAIDWRDKGAVNAV